MTMKIDHIACWTEDIDRSCDFYIKYFQAKVNPPYHNPVKRHTTRFLDFPGGGRLELMHHPDIHQRIANPGDAHIGFIHLSFSVGSRENVDGLTEHLRKDGFPVIDGPRLTGDGYYESSILDPDGNRLEITV
jgi:lactoylglutathione lyase